MLEGAAAPKSRIRITVLTILALHVVFIGGLLLQGCQKGSNDGTQRGPSNAVTSLPSLTDTQYFTTFPGDVTSSSTVTSTPPESLTSSSSTTGVTRGSQEPLIPEVISPGFGSTRQTSSVPAFTPAAPASAGATEHVIEKNDRISDLAKRYGVSVQAILDANPDVQPRALKLGSRLTIPAPVPGAARVEPELNAPPGGEIYIVKSGDNLTKIARKFGVTVKQLRAANSLRSDRLLPKQRLVIPPKNGTGSEASGPTGGSTF
jgi:LysM repeat protein